MNIAKIISDELGVKLTQTESAIALLDEGNTVPFIARYRKEATGKLDDQQLRLIEERLAALRALDERKNDVFRLISEQGNMTEEIERQLSAAATVAEVDDIYRPFRPKRRTRASIAKEKGLEPLANLLLAQVADLDIEAKAAEFADAEKGVNSAQEALQGAMDIISEQISDNAEYRKWIREFTLDHGFIVTKAKTEEDSVYRLYYDHKEPCAKLPSHRCLAIDRAEREKFITVKIEVDRDRMTTYLKFKTCAKNDSPSKKYVELACEDAYDRLIEPSVQNEVRNILTERSQDQAIHVFGENLKNLLLVPPVRGHAVMGFDPAYRTGCKIAIVNEVGDVLATTVVYPTPPQNKTEEAKKVLLALIEKYNVDIISIGNGTASKESEIFVADMLKSLPRKVSYIMTSEAGASVYSASKLAADEFPQFDVSLRSAVSIARRLQDPKSIGVGQYQHDMNPKHLSESLDGVVENCVSSVGADLNTASVSLLSHIAGINAKTAKAIYDYRTENKKFKSRSELKKVKGIGEKAYVQCVGFLRVPDSAEVLDNTAVHPESYAAARALLEELGYTENDVKSHALSNIDALVEEIGISELAKKLGVGEMTLADIISEIKRPGRDPRDELPKPVLRSDVMDINSLKAGMEFVGTVRNVADFGAFVDIGVHQDGLVHISRLSDKFVKRAMDVVSIGDIIKVRIIDVDVPKKRISLERIPE